MSDNSEDPIDLDLEAYRVAKEVRNLEIGLFWQRSNYFLVLNTAIAVGFFSLRNAKYEWPLAAFGLVIAALWILVNLGGKFWQCRWEHRLRVVEKKLRPDMNLFSASWETIKDDVRQSFEDRKRGILHHAYSRLVLLKPSVSLTMTGLSVAFLGFWALMLIGYGTGNTDVPVGGANGPAALPAVAAHAPSPFWLSLSEATKNWVEVFALLVGGGWALWRFRLRREGVSAFEIALSHRCVQEANGCVLTYFDGTITNKGAVRIVAKKEQRPAYKDAKEILEHSYSLLLRPLSATGTAGTQVRWFADTNASSPLPGDIEADLLDEYEVDGVLDFYVEPLESYPVSVGVWLTPGNYLAMVSFVGESGPHELWRRVFIVQVDLPQARP